MFDNRLIEKVKPHSPAERAGITAGEKLLLVNKQDFSDIIDLSFLFADEYLELELLSETGEKRLVKLEKDIDEELGLEFSGAVFDGVRECANACIFCFVDQMAPGMRKSLYVKDDDYRLSFLYGNFVTFTNFTQEDEKRILKLHLSPLYVSVQATDEDVRRKLLRSKRAGELLSSLKRLADGGIQFHTQVVACPGINDGQVLEQTFCDLRKLDKAVLSMAVVPVGLTKYRAKSPELRTFMPNEAAEIVRTVALWQEECRKTIRRSFIYASDEFYIQAGIDIPPTKNYDGFPQYENGVGIVRKFIDEWREEKIPLLGQKAHTGVICGMSAQSILQPLLDAGNREFGGGHYLVPVKNDFFGDLVTVTGLLTGQDIIKAVMKLPEYPQRLVLPGITLRDHEDIFLDGMALGAFRENLSCELEVAHGAAELKRLLWGG